MMNPLQNLMQNPVEILKQAGYNIPHGMKDPNQILQYMLQNNPMLQQRYQQLMSMFGKR